MSEIEAGKKLDILIKFFSDFNKMLSKNDDKKELKKSSIRTA